MQNVLRGGQLQQIRGYYLHPAEQLGRGTIIYHYND